METQHTNSHGIVFNNGKATGTYIGKNYHAVGTTQLFANSIMTKPIKGSYLDDGEVASMVVFSDGAALVEYHSKAYGCWKCGYARYSEQLDNIW